MTMDQPPAIVIEHDPGGKLGDYIERRGRYERGELRVEIRGECFSACTLLAGLPKACVGSAAVLGFHAPLQTFGNLMPRSGESFFSAVMMTYYPKPMQQWVIDNGGLTETMIYLKGAALAAIVPKCKGAK